MVMKKESNMRGRSYLIVTIFFSLVAVALGLLDSRIEVRGSITVPRGRSRFIEPQDLKLDPFIKSNTTCKVMARVKERATLRVGVVTPQVFDCSWKPNTVLYQHSGSPLLQHDVVQMTALLFHNDSTVSTIYCQLDVEIIDLPYDIFTSPAGSSAARSLLVSAGNGLSNIISHPNFTFAYKSQHGDGESCRVGVQKGRGRFPQSGNITAGNERTLQQFLNGTMDCQEFLHAGIRYRHSGGAGPNQDFLPLVVERENDEIFDDDDVNMEREFIYLPIEIKGKQRNSAPTVITSQSLLAIPVEEFSPLVLNSMILSAYDDETEDEFLIFNITSEMIPSMYGYFTRTNDYSVQIRSFSQKEVTDGQISYHPPTNDVEHETDITFEIIAFDKFFLSSEKSKLTFRCLPSKSSGPQVFVEKEFFVLEGSQRVLTQEYLSIRNVKSIEGVEIEIEKGPQHGSIKEKNSKVKSFTGKDLIENLVVYVNEEKDFNQDSVVLKVRHGGKLIHTKLVIKLIQTEDSSPFLSTNIPLKINSGGFQQISKQFLFAEDRDTESNRDILYHIVSQPKSGEVVLRHHEPTRGKRVLGFSQEDIDKGLIYYQHLEDLRDELDSVEFYLQNKNQSPNKSGIYRFEININPINNLSPHPSDDAIRQATVDDTNPFSITNKHLEYNDVNEDSQSLQYYITRLPYFINSIHILNAGYIAKLPSINDTNIQPSPISNFTQKDVNEGLIHYIPPRDGVRLGIRHARFRFAVCDSLRSCIMDQEFDLMLVGSNRTSPALLTEPLVVGAAGTVRLTSRNLLSYDQFSDNDMIEITLVREPGLGYIVKNNVRMGEGEGFKLEDLSSTDIRYINNNTSSTRDRIDLSISDGINHRLLGIPIIIQSNTLMRPEPLKDLETRITVVERGVFELSTRNLAAVDNDTDKRELIFMSVKRPELGELRLDGKKVDQFVQGDLIDGKVSYAHTYGEIGMTSALDVMTFAVFDQRMPGASEKLPLLDLEITILPLDNSPPELLVGGPLIVVDGQAASITSDIISARDPDSPEGALQFIVAQTPMWGFLERSKVTSRSGRSQTSRRISSFTLMDLQEGSIQYMPSNLFKGLPPSDSFFIYATDGQNQSPLSQVEVSILSGNVQLPDFEVPGTLDILEGGEKEIRIGITGGGEGGKADRAKISVTTPPLHGELILVQGKAGDSDVMSRQVRFHDVIVERKEREEGVRILYRHDGGESTSDRFALSLSEGIHVVKKTCIVNVIPVNDARPELIRAGPLYVDYGGTRLITTSILKVMDDDTTNDGIVFTIVTSPRRGILELEIPTSGNTQGMWKMIDKDDNFTQKDIDDNRVRFTHTLDLEDTASDSFSFHVTDGVFNLPISSFPIEIARTSRRRFLLHNKGLTATEGEIKIISKDVLRAYDGTAEPSKISFVVVDAPLYGNVTYIQSNMRSVIQRFTQDDVNHGVIYYVSTTRPTNNEDRVTLAVTSSNLPNVSPHVTTLKTTLRPNDGALPVLVINKPLTVVQGDVALISTLNLYSSFENNVPGNITYIVLDRPKHGQLLNNGFPITWAFTQRDITSGHVVYAHDKTSEALSDYFLFSVTDNRHDGYLINGTLQKRPAFFNILIQQAAKEAPKLITNRSPSKLETLGYRQHGYTLTGDHLKAVHPIFSSAEISYIIKDKPKYGLLEYKESGKPVKKRFTQKDLDDGAIVYILNEFTRQGTNDSLTFRLEDANRNIVDDLRFEIRWSVLRMNETRMVVCEDEGHVEVKVIREGHVDSYATAELKAKQLSASEGLDFLLPVNPLVVFEPGVREVSIKIDILADRFEGEENEKFKIILRHPESCLLDENSRVTITIINVKNGRCDDDNGRLQRRLLDDDDEDKNSKDKNNHRDNLYDSYSSSSYDDYVTGDVIKSQDEEWAYTSWGFSNKWNNPVNDPGNSLTGDHNTGGGPTGWDWNEKWTDKNGKEKNKNKKNKKKENKTNNKKNKIKKDDLFKKWGNEDDFNGNYLSQSGAWNKVEQKTSPTTTTTTTTTTTLSTTTVKDAFSPQKCTQETSGLLYFNLVTSVMYRCNGAQWEEWGWGGGGGSQLYSALLKDSTSHQVSGQNNEKYEDDDADDDVDDVHGYYDYNTDIEKAREKTKALCPSGWKEYSSRCYKLAEGRATWKVAQSECEKIDGSELTDVTSYDHLVWLWNLSKEAKFWTGITDRKTHGRWLYKDVSGKENEQKYFNWRKTFPRIKSRDSNCVMVNKKKEWVNRPCNKAKAKFICVKNLFSTTSNKAW